jgi:DinB superfamily
MKKGFLIIFLIISACSNKKENTAAPIWTEKDRAYLINEFKSTKEVIHQLVDNLNYEQWHYKLTEKSWSIGYIIEHLQLQEDMHYREVRIMSMQPAQPKDAIKTIGNDEKVLAYANDPTKGIADWNVTPLGRWPTKKSALLAFDRSRDQMIDLITNMKADLRQQVTYRNLSDETDFRRVRNLHQILLTTIAHIKRHTIQIEEILIVPNFPN